mgnify:CR=1 FL=1
MKFPSKQFIDTKKLPFLTYIYAASIINILIIGTTFLIQNLLPPEIPLYYGLAEGQEQIAKSIFLFVPNSISLLILIINSAIASYIKQDYYKKILIVAGLISTFFASITVFKIVFLVGSF